MSTIFPPNATINQTFNGYQFDGTSWRIIGIDLTEDYITQNEFDTYQENTIKTYIQDTQPNFGGKKAIWVQTGLGESNQDFSVWINT